MPPVVVLNLLHGKVHSNGDLPRNNNAAPGAKEVCLTPFLLSGAGYCSEKQQGQEQPVPERHGASRPAHPTLPTHIFSCGGVKQLEKLPA